MIYVVGLKGLCLNAFSFERKVIFYVDVFFSSGATAARQTNVLFIYSGGQLAFSVSS
jgi:hypothetical protein